MQLTEQQRAELERRAGYCIVPEDVIRNAIQICDMHINLARAAYDLDVTPLVKDTRQALASALQGEEVETR